MTGEDTSPQVDRRVRLDARGTDGRALSARALRRRFAWALALALAVYIALLAYGDLEALRAHLVGFPWAWLPLILALTLVNYGGRLAKWLWYLRLVGARIGYADGARVFGVGMSMVLTPGKAGELLKSYMVKRVSGTPMRVTAPIVLAERLTDGLAMLVLAGGGLYGLGDPTMRRGAALLLAALLGVVVAVQIRPLALAALRVGESVPLVRRFAAHLHDFYESSYTLLRPRNLLVAVGIGLLSWTCEGLAYYLVVLGVRGPESPNVVAAVGASLTDGPGDALAAVFIFSISTVLGAVAATPGGLGATESSLVLLSQRMLGLASAPATAAALLIRFATLWFGVALGVLSLARWPGLLSADGDADDRA